MINNTPIYSHKPRCFSQYINLALQTLIAFTLLSVGIYLLKIRNSYGYNILSKAKPDILLIKSALMFFVIVIYSYYGEKLVTVFPYICIGVLPGIFIVSGFVPIITINPVEQNYNETFTKCCKSLTPDFEKCSFITSEYECSSYEYFKALAIKGPNFLAWIYVPLSFLSCILVMFYPFSTYKLLKYENKLPIDIMERDNEQQTEENRYKKFICPIFASDDYNNFKKKHYIFYIPLLIVSFSFVVVNVYLLFKRQNYGYNAISLTRCIVWIILSSILFIITLFFKTVCIKCKTSLNEGYYIYSFIFFIICSSLFVLYTADIVPTVYTVNETYDNCCVKNLNTNQCNVIISNNKNNVCKDIYSFYQYINGELYVLIKSFAALLTFYDLFSLFGGLITYSKRTSSFSKEEKINVNLI